MSHPGPAAQAAISLARWALVIIFSPVILVAGEPVNRWVMRRATARVVAVRRDDRTVFRVAAGPPLRRASVLLMVIHHPLWIALTAPGRWVSDRLPR